MPPNLHPNLHSNGERRPAYWSLKGLREGMLIAVPLLPGVLMFGIAFGAVAVKKGLTVADAALMSTLVFAGASQFVAVEIWTDPILVSTLVTLALAVGVVNMRLLLMGASLHPWLSTLPAWQVYPALLFTIDASWIVALRHRAEGGSDASVFLGSSLLLWLFWIPSTVAGCWLGGFIADPRTFGIDLILPIFFMCMLVPLWRGARGAVPWMVAGVVAIVTQYLVADWWFMIVGALAGSITGGLMHDPE